jgi:hypothetical protein
VAQLGVRLHKIVPFCRWGLGGVECLNGRAGTTNGLLGYIDVELRGLRHGGLRGNGWSLHGQIRGHERPVVKHGHLVVDHQLQADFEHVLDSARVEHGEFVLRHEAWNQIRAQVPIGSLGRVEKFGQQAMANLWHARLGVVVNVDGIVPVDSAKLGAAFYDGVEAQLEIDKPDNIAIIKAQRRHGDQLRQSGEASVLILLVERVEDLDYDCISNRRGTPRNAPRRLQITYGPRPWARGPSLLRRASWSMVLNCHSDTVERRKRYQLRKLLRWKRIAVTK